MNNQSITQSIICAAYNTAEELKKNANFVCDKYDARPTLQEAVDKADSLDLPCVLLPGTYVINSRSERTKKGAICFFNPESAGKWYCQTNARYHILEGAKIPLGYYSGALITVGKELYDSLSEDEEFSLFFSAGNSPMGRGMIMKNLNVRIPGSKKPIVVFDGRFAGAIRYEDCWCSTFDPKDVKNLATAEGIAVPNPKCVAFRGSCGSNFYSTEWKNLVAVGFGVGFDIGGEHVYCESLSALYNIYGFRFDCYKGKNSIEDPDDKNALGYILYPITCVNLLDEHNVHMPCFGNASHNGNTLPEHSHEITIRGMNLQWPNSAPGYTDRTAPDFLEGRHRATEWQQGSWVGSIEYILDHTTPTSGVVLCREPFFEEGHGQRIRSVNFLDES